MKYHSDLAAECRELVPNCEGIAESQRVICNVTVKTLHIKTDAASELIGRRKGIYSTIELGTLPPVNINEVATVIKNEITRLLPKRPKTVLVAGLGNRNITPDAIGPRTAAGVIATRHISEEFARNLGLEDLESVAVITPGVLGQTGIETAEIVKSSADVVSADAVIVIDALTAASVTRLCNTVQITNSGIHPGSGVGNRRSEISSDTLGVPCVAIGVPTVVNASTLVSESTGQSGKGAPEMIVTPKDIDSVADTISKLLAKAVNLALHPDISAETIESIM